MVLKVVFIAELYILLFIFYQDLKYRAVNWIAFLAITLSGFFLSFHAVGLKNTLFNVLLNNGILLMQLLLVYLFYYVKSGMHTKIINKKLGLGDVLMLAALSFSFSPVNYIVFVFLSLVASLLITMVKRNKQTIPLAGYLGLFYFIFLMINHFFLDFNPYLIQPDL